MNCFRYLLFMLFTWVLASSARSQTKSLDSLKQIIKTTDNDSIRLTSKLYYGEELPIYRYSFWDSLAHETLEANLASFYATCLNNKGYIALAEGKIELAIDNFSECILIMERIDDQEGVATALNNLSSIYLQQKDFEKALEYSKKAAETNIQINDSVSLSNCLNTIGAIYQRINEHQLAVEYFNQSLNILKHFNRNKSIGLLYNNLGISYHNLGNLDSAMKYHQMGLEQRLKYSSAASISNSYHNIGEIHRSGNEINQALQYGLKSHEYAVKDSFPEALRVSSRLLYLVYKKKEMWYEALEMYELHIQMRDSMKNEETQKAAIRQQTKYEFEKAQLVKEQEEKEAARVLAEETSRRNNLQYSLIFLGILLFFGVVLSLGFIKVSPTVAEGLIFFAFLILFEFLLVLSDPFVDSITGGEPIYKLLANAVLAGAIFPAHAFFERTLKKRLIK